MPEPAPKRTPPEAYYSDDTVTLYVGDCREILPALGVTADLVVADPPYGETAHTWDRWPNGWVSTVAACAPSLWCFGSLRMFLDRRDEFGEWRMSQDVVWEKPNPTSLRADRFRRTHEQVAFWYTGEWRDAYKDPQRTAHDGPKLADRSGNGRRPQHWEYDGRPPLGEQGWADTGTRLATSVIKVRSMHMRAIHPHEKPLGILDPLIRYACPPGGLVVDPFAGSGSTLDAARQSGRRAIGVEANEEYAAKAKRRLEQLTIGVGA